ncbi:MAG: hypothetical protein Phyf2KO_26180 [Phycisphaerales bacterium]
MKDRFVAALVGGIALCAGHATGQQLLMVPDSTDDRIMLFNSFDGSLVNADFINEGVVGDVMSTPIEAQLVGNEIWVTDQIGDVVNRFSADGSSFLGAISNPSMDNLRGFEVVGNTALVAGIDGVHRIDVNTQTYLGLNEYRGADSSLFDIYNHNGILLAANNGVEDIDIIDLNGDYVQTVIDSDGVTSIDFPEQIAGLDNGNFMAAGFSSPSGIYEFTTEGDDLGIIAAADAGPRGAYELGNGNIMYTNGSGVFVFDINTGGATQVASGSARFISELVPAPSSATLLAFAGLCASRRRR